MNKWIGLGRLTKDPELRATGTGKSVATFSVAIDDGWGDNKTTDYIDIVAWEKTAENCAKFLKKGSLVGVVGKIKKRSYEKDGRKIWITEVKADEVEFLGSKSSTQEAPSSSFVPPDFEEVEDDDLPF
jgi:single-strand DNA-binding protein